MNDRVDKSPSKDSQPAAEHVVQNHRQNELSFTFEDNRPETVAQRKLQQMANNSAQVRQLKALQRMVDEAGAEGVIQGKALKEGELNVAGENHPIKEMALKGIERAVFTPIRVPDPAQ